MHIIRSIKKSKLYISIIISISLLVLIIILASIAGDSKGDQVETSNQDKTSESEVESELDPDIEKGYELSHGECEGRGSVTLSTSPMKESDFSYIIPYGLMVGAHVTPIDHMYFVPADWDSPRDAYEVMAMADARIVSLEYRGDNTSGEDGEYRIVFSHTCTFFTYFDLVTSLKPSLEEEFEKNRSGNYASINISVTEGELIGYIGGQTLDFAVWDTETELEGFVIPEHYDSEPWKIYTADPYNYCSEELSEFLTERNIRTAEPIAGKIDYDVDGRLVGNWFLEGTNGYQGLDQNNYWSGHLSFVYNHIDPDAVIISIGDFEGEAKQFAVEGNEPDPRDVDTSSELIKYTLVDFEYEKTNGESWDRMSFEKNLKLEGCSQIHGCMLVQMIEDRKIEVEVFSDVNCSEVNRFTKNSKIYER